MKNLTFNIDYTYCPKGHGTWTHIPSSTLYSDIFFCEDCDCFYQPSVRAIKRGTINKNYNSDREGDLIKMAKFINWKKQLTMIDMNKLPITPKGK